MVFRYDFRFHYGFHMKSAGFLMISWNLTKDQISGKFTTVTIVMTVHASVKLSYFMFDKAEQLFCLGNIVSVKITSPSNMRPLICWCAVILCFVVFRIRPDSKKCFTVSDPPTGVRCQETPHFELPFRRQFDMIHHAELRGSSTTPERGSRIEGCYGMPN